MGVSAAKYARLCDSVGLRYSKAQWVAWAYPEARETPGMHDSTSSTKPTPSHRTLGSARSQGSDCSEARWTFAPSVRAGQR